MLFGAKKLPPGPGSVPLAERLPDDAPTTLRRRLDELDDEVQHLRHRFAQLQARVTAELRRYAREADEEFLDEEDEPA